MPSPFSGVFRPGECARIHLVEKCGTEADLCVRLPEMPEIPGEGRRSGFY